MILSKKESGGEDEDEDGSLREGKNVFLYDVWVE